MNLCVFRTTQTGDMFTQDAYIVILLSSDILLYPLFLLGRALDTPVRYVFLRQRPGAFWFPYRSLSWVRLPTFIPKYLLMGPLVS